MLKFLSSEYQLYACGKNFSQALTLNENHPFAKGSLEIARDTLFYRRTIQWDMM
jgi:hypothetical protein